MITAGEAVNDQADDAICRGTEAQRLFQFVFVNSSDSNPHHSPREIFVERHLRRK